MNNNNGDHHPNGLVAKQDVDLDLELTGRRNWEFAAYGKGQTRLEVLQVRTVQVWRVYVKAYFQVRFFT